MGALPHLKVIGRARLRFGYHTDDVAIYACPNDRPLVALGLTAQTIQFLLNNLPEGDGFTEDLFHLREEMKEMLWAREA